MTAACGRSNTRRRSTPVTGRARSPARERPHQAGSCRNSRSGRVACASVLPSCPSCPPGLRPVFFRSDRGDGLPSPSLDGGREELRGVCLSRASSSAIRSRACASSSTARARAACDPASSARSEATKAASTSSAEPASSPGTPGRYYDPTRHQDLPGDGHEATAMVITDSAQDRWSLRRQLPAGYALSGPRTLAAGARYIDA